jgi:hypothetical protein
MGSLVVSTSQTTTENLSSADDDLLVTSSGSIIVTTGDGNVGIDSTANSQEITINSLVYAAFDGTDVGVEITDGLTSLTVKGQVEGDAGVDVSQGVLDRITVGNQGAVDGLASDGVEFVGNFGHAVAADNSLNNAGYISGDIDGVLSEYGGGDTINNSGQISGEVGVYLDGNVATDIVENTGTITDDANDSVSGSAIFTAFSSAGIDVINSGTITDDGANALNSGGAVLYFDDNSGKTSTIDNTGTISGLGYVIQSISDILDISNSGMIHGGLDLAHDDDALINSHAGTIDGRVTLAAGGDTITNAGDIYGAITFTGTGITNSLTNSGEITGNITFSSAHSTLTNSGSMTGDLTMVGTDTLINTGVIHGDVTLGVSDIIELSVGEVTGAITGKTNDLFAFSGNFGNETIDKFIGGTGSTHDTIRFATNDFGSFAAVQSHMSQVGADVAIRLDGTDTITLAGVKLSNLVSADFKFV